jgi:hypothetical protein
LSQIPNLKQVLDAYVQVQHANLAGIVTDESGDSAKIDGLLQDFAERLNHFADSSYVSPPTFLGVGGAILFRDSIWGRLRFPFLADHKAFKRHGFYDFPQKKIPSRIITWFMLLLTKIPVVRKEMYTKKMKPGMLHGLPKIIEKE